eukprot:comp13795_c0_seq1/m.9510 comp13795_c0_seq1/g.9510  ORF comp13795_c0_seq1/g.9510 comp13795_c0_seq1/m.9510 type:complete len:605 (-) comp13795_c0_seq1:334-2148(-)
MSNSEDVIPCISAITDLQRGVMWVRITVEPVVILLSLIALGLYIHRRHQFPISEQWPTNGIITCVSVILWAINDVFYALYTYGSFSGVNIVHCVWGNRVSSLLDISWCALVLTAAASESSRALWVCANHYRTHFMLDPVNSFDVMAQLNNSSASHVHDWENTPHSSTSSNGKRMSRTESGLTFCFWTWNSHQTARFVRLVTTYVVPLFAALFALACVAVYIPALLTQDGKRYDMAYDASTVLMAVGVSMCTPIVHAVSILLIMRVSTFADTTNITTQLKVLAVFWWFWLIPSLCDMTTIRVPSIGLLISLQPLCTCLVVITTLATWPLALSYRAHKLTNQRKGSVTTTCRELIGTLEDREKRNALRVFMACEFAVENLHFWEAVEGYKRRLANAPAFSSHGGDLHSMCGRIGGFVTIAERLYDVYIDSTAICQVNVPGNVRTHIHQQLESIREHHLLLRAYCRKRPQGHFAGASFMRKKLSLNANNQFSQSSLSQIERTKSSFTLKSTPVSNVHAPTLSIEVGLDHVTEVPRCGTDEIVINSQSDAVIGPLDDTHYAQWANDARAILTTIFDSAETHVVNIIATDVFPRYLAHVNGATALSNEV